MRFSKFFIVVIGFCMAVHLWPVYGQDGDELRQFQYAEKLFKDGMYELAAMQYQAFLDRYAGSPKAPEALYQLGETQFQAGHYALARAAFLKLILAHADSDRAPAAQFRMAESLEKERSFSEAASGYYRLFVYFPKHSSAAEALLRAAECREKADGFDAAEPWFRQLILSHAESREAALATLALAHGLAQSGNRQEALSLYQRLVDHPVSENDKWTALSRLAPLAVLEGEWARAESAYRLLAQSAPQISDQQTGHLGVARIAASLSRYEAARTAYRAALALSGGRQSAIYAALGDMEVAAGRTEQALAAYENALKSRNAATAPIHLLEAVGSLLRQGKTRNVYNACQTVYQDSTADQGHRAQALLLLAALSRVQGEYAVAVKQYADFTSTYADHALLVHADLMRARLLIDELGGVEAGLAVLRQLMTRYPAHALMDEVHFRYARAAESAGLYSDARRGYTWVARHGAWSAFANASRVALNRLGEGEAPDWLGLMLSLSEIESGQNVAQRQFALGKTLLKTHGQAEVARRFLEAALEKTSDADWRDEGALLLAQTFRFDEQGALAAYRKAAATMADGPLRDQALAGVALLQDSVDVAPLLYLAGRIADVDMVNRLRLKLGKAWMAGAQHIQADSVLSMLSPDASPALSEEALVLRIKAGRADSLYSGYFAQYASGLFWPEMRFLKASRDKDVSGLREVIAKAPHTAWADSARLLLGEELNHQKQFTEAEAVFRDALRLAHLHEAAFSVALETGPAPAVGPFKKGLAESLLGQKKTHEARILLEESMTAIADPTVQIWGWRLLASLSEASGEIDRAAWYLEQRAKAQPTDSSWTALAQLYFRHEQFDKAQGVYDRLSKDALGNAGDASAWSIICLFRRGRISQGETRSTQFRQLHKRHAQFKAYTARFDLERGMALASIQRFDSAVKALEAAAKSKQDEVVPMAEVELGKTYLIMAHVDEALKILTAMPRKYAGNAVLDRVYFYLGEHYFNSKQYENATLAYRWVVDNGQTPSLRPAALRLLVRCYETIGRADGAMATVRQFIRDYPQDPDRLNMEVKIGSLYMSLAEYDRAIEIFRRLRPLADADTEAEIQFKIGQSMALSGRCEEAVFEYLKVSYLSRETKLPWKTTAIFEAGRAFIKMHQLDRALSMFELVIRRDGANGMFGKVARREIETLQAQMKDEEGGKG